MNEWYQDKTSSKYGCRLNWSDLIDSMLEEEPTSTKEGLVFETGYSQLPIYLQQGILSFLLHHRQSIPKSCLKLFTESIESTVHKDTWIGVLYRMIVAFIQSNTDTVGMLCDYQYEFTTENQLYQESVSLKLKDKEPVKSPWSIPVQLHVCHEKNTEEHEEINPLKLELETNIIECKVTSPDIIVIDDEEPPTKLIKTEHFVITQSQVDQSQMISVKDVDLDIDIQPEDLEQMKRLKEKWENGDNADIPDEINILSNCRTSVIERLCEDVNLTDMSEVAIETACRQMTEKCSMISHSNCTVLLSALLLKKIKEMNQSASRSLLGVVTMVAESFAKPLIEGVFVPVTEDRLLGTFQADLLVKICKDVLTNTDKVYFLELIVRSQVMATENLLTVLQTIFDAKLDVESSLLLTILEILKDHGDKFEKNLKYGKLVLALINRYGGQMTTEHKEILLQILMTHKSFLKKSIQSAATKL